MKRDEREYEALSARVSPQLLSRGVEGRVEAGGATHLQILHQVIEHAQALRVLAVLDVDERANFCGLAGERVTSAGFASRM